MGEYIESPDMTPTKYSIANNYVADPNKDVASKTVYGRYLNNVSTELVESSLKSYEGSVELAKYESNSTMLITPGSSVEITISHTAELAYYTNACKQLKYLTLTESVKSAESENS